MAFVKDWQSERLQLIFNANGPNNSGDFEELLTTRIGRIIASVSPDTEIIAYIKSHDGNYVIVTEDMEDSTVWGRMYHYYMWDSLPTRQEIVKVFKMANPFEGDEMFQEKLSPSLQEAHDRYVNKKFNDILFEKAILEDHLLEIDVQHTFGFDEPETVEIEDYPGPKEEMTPEQREEWIDKIIEEIDAFAQETVDFYDENYFSDALADSWTNSVDDVKWKDVLNEPNFNDAFQNELLYKLKAKNLSVEDLADDIYNAASIHITSQQYHSPSGGFVLANWTMDEGEISLPEEIVDDLFLLDEEEYKYVSSTTEVIMPEAEELHHGLKPPNDLMVTISVGISAWLIITSNDLKDIIETETSDVDMSGYTSPIQPKTTTEPEEVMGNPFEGDEMFSESTKGTFEVGDTVEIMKHPMTSLVGAQGEIDLISASNLARITIPGTALIWAPFADLKKIRVSPFDGDEMFQESASRDYWDANLEYNPLRKKSYDDDSSAGAFLAYKIENAGDIIRELGKTWVDMGYIMEKINKIVNSLSNRRDWVIDQLSPTEQSILQKMRSQVVEIPEDLPGIVEVKSMLLGIIDRNVQRVEQYAELAEQEIRRYLKEKE